MRPAIRGFVTAIAFASVFAAATPPASFSLRTAGHKIGDKLTDPKDGTIFVWVPGGSFLYGGDSTAKSLGGFWIARNDVTVKQWRRFCAATGRPAPSGDDSHPATNIAWPDAVAYASWAGATLPTEAQWEKAARGVDGRAYPWGNHFDPANCQSSVDSPKSSVAAVGSFPGGKSVYGCFDMAGNVNQWTLSYFDSDHPDRVTRGGSAWETSADELTSYRRNSTRATSHDKGIGFRLCGPEIR
jgi:serine/threonine-protein kinase